MTQHTKADRVKAGRDLIKAGSKTLKSSETMDGGIKAPIAIRLGAYGRYQIKSGYIAGVYTARAFPKPPTHARGLIAEATGETEEAAINALQSAIDLRETRRSEHRRTDTRTGTPVPTSDEYLEALNAINLTQPQRAMLLALSLAEENGLKRVMVARAGSYKSTTSAKNALANVGRMISSYLFSETDSEEPSILLDGHALIVFCDDSGHEEKLSNWILHPELCAAIRIAL